MLPQGLPRDPLWGLGITFISGAGSVPSCTESSPAEPPADIRERSMSTDWWKTAWARGYTKNLVGAAKRDGLAQSSFLHSQIFRTAGHGCMVLLRLSWAARTWHGLLTEIYFLLAVLTLPTTFSGNPGLSLRKQSRVCFVERQLMFFCPPLFICNEDPDHQFLFIMEKRTRLRLTGQ